MFRSTSVLALLAAMTWPVLAADYDNWGALEDEAPLLRSTYSGIEPRDWTSLGDVEDPLGFEFGIRYWYSMGAQNFSTNILGTTATEDNAHTGELHLRIDDYSTNSFAKANLGYSAAVLGTYSTPSSTGSIGGGEVGYAGADFGWNAIGNNAGSGAGFLVGYEYWNDSPRTDRDNYAVVSSASDVSYNPDTGAWSFGVDGVERHIDVHALRLGVSGKAKLSEMFDISAEAVAVPFASVNGRMGGGMGGGIPPMPLSGCNIPPPGSCGPLSVASSARNVEGWGYGAMGEVMAGFHPTENLTVRVGGRLWYLQGSYDTTFTAVDITAPQLQPQIEDPDNPGNFIDPDPLYSAPQVAADDYIITGNPFQMIRYGLLAELTYAF